jgi:TonB family protein
MNTNANDASGRTCVSNYQVTILDHRGFIERLTTEIRYAINQLKPAWAELKKNPAGFGVQLMLHGFKNLGTRLRGPRVVLSSFVSITFVISTILLIGLTPTSQSAGPADIEVKLIDLKLADAESNHGPGVGANSNGRVGVSKGSGEGSLREFKKARGGGGSGNHDALPSQGGQLLPPSPIPAPLLKLPKNPALPKAGIDIDPALWAAQPLLQYGDPRSASSTPSHGPGEGGNFGNANGLGTGEGDGNGFGPGRKGNTGGSEKESGGGKSGGSDGDNADPVRRLTEVTQRARILTKPEPEYTEEARRNQITGAVVLRVVFSASGQVVDIRTVSGLPFGLTERAISAARRIRFVPATKDNRPVSVYMQLEYNFNLY